MRFTDFNPIRTNGQAALGAPLSSDWASSTYDVKHNLSATFLADLPFGRGHRFLPGASGFWQGLLGGWSLSGSGRIQTGVPLVVVLRDDNGLGVAGNVRAVRPDLVPGEPLLNPLWSRGCPVGQQCEPYFNPAAFMRPVKGQFGNAPRTLDQARWPTQQYLDLSLRKDFDLGGKRRLQLRVDAIDVLNHPFFKFGRDSDNGEIFALPSEALLTTAEFNAWAGFNAEPRAGTPAGDALRQIADAIVIGGRIPGTTALVPDFFHVPVPQGFHSTNPNQFDVTTPDGFRLYRLRQAYTPDRWGFGRAGTLYSALHPDRGEVLFLSRLRDLDGVDLGSAVHVGAEHDPLAVGREGDVGLEAVVVAGEVDERLRLQAIAPRAEQVDPLPVAGGGHAVRPAAVACEERPIR